MKKILLFLCAIFLFSCSDITRDEKTVKIEEPESALPEPEPEPVKRIWTILIYMAADNNLESEAIADINEIESVFPQDSPYTILTLFDRAVGYNGTNGDWTDTRLYEIQRDPDGLSGTIVSRQLDCPDLDLHIGNATELDMAEPNTLRKFVSFAKREFSANYYALIFWGHGTGWRSVQLREDPPERAIAIDDFGGTFMDLVSLKTALTSLTVNVIGFDTCFGATLETLYEICPVADYLVASQGIIPAAGWDYADILTRFSASAMTADNLASAVTASFAAQYAAEPDYSVSRVALAGVRPFAQAFCAFSAACADGITTSAMQDELFALIMNTVKKEHAASYPADMFVDTGDFVPKLDAYFQAASIEDAKKQAIHEAALIARAKLESACIETYRGGVAANLSISVFYSVLSAPEVCAASHPEAYRKDSLSAGQSSFVKETSGWTPTAAANVSLLDKLFYAMY